VELTVCGTTHRVRYETLDGQFRAGKTGSDQILNFRTFLKFDIDLPRWDATVEFEDSRQQLADEGTLLSTGIVNPFELLQANVTWSGKDWLIAGSKSTLTTGRMTMDVGSRRFVARNRFRNTRNAFTGIDWVLKLDQDQTFRAFYTLPVMRKPSDFRALLDNEVKWDQEYSEIRFWGLYYEKKNLPASGIGELYLYGLDEDDNEDIATKNRNLLTPGLRYCRKPHTGQFDYEVEATLQWGTTRANTKATNTTDLDVFAEFIHISAGYSFDTAWKPRLVLQYDYASGDKDPTDGDFEGFDTLYGIGRFELCPTGVYGPVGRNNLSTPGFHLFMSPGKRTKLMIAYRYFWLASAKDAWAKAKVADPSGASGNDLGSQIEFRLTWDAIPGNLKTEIGGAYFNMGRFAESVPNATSADETTYGYVQATVQF
jgi:hypothetical protein